MARSSMGDRRGRATPLRALLEVRESVSHLVSHTSANAADCSGPQRADSCLELAPAVGFEPTTKRLTAARSPRSGHAQPDPPGESPGESHPDEELVICGFCGWDETVSEPHPEDCGR